MERLDPTWDRLIGNIISPLSQVHLGDAANDCKERLKKKKKKSRINDHIPSYSDRNRRKTN